MGNPYNTKCTGRPEKYGIFGQERIICYDYRYRQKTNSRPAGKRSSPAFLPAAGGLPDDAGAMSDTPRALTYLKTLDKIFIQNDHRWTMYNAEAAHAALAADALLGYAA